MTITDSTDARDAAVLAWRALAKRVGACLAGADPADATKLAGALSRGMAQPSSHGIVDPSTQWLHWFVTKEDA